MKMLYYGYYVYLILQLLLTGSILQLFFGLLMLWILYINYATCSFCQSIFCMVILGMNSITLFALPFDSRYAAPVRIISGLMLIYNIIGLIWCYQAF